jgi:hypothetical protein
MDTFSGLPSNLTAPARDGASVTPSDSTNLTVVPRALYVGATGNVSAVLVGGQTISFQGVQSGTLLPVRVTRVNATGTTATGIVALW